MKKEFKEQIQLSISQKIKEELFIELTSEEIKSLEVADSSYIGQERYSCAYNGMTLDVYVLLGKIQEVVLFRLVS